MSAGPAVADGIGEQIIQHTNVQSFIRLGQDSLLDSGRKRETAGPGQLSLFFHCNLRQLA